MKFLSIFVSVLYCIWSIGAEDAFKSDCFAEREVEYLYIDSVSNFPEAETGCEEQDPTAELASLSDIETTHFVNNFIESIKDTVQSFWIGLTRPSDAELEANGTTNFGDPTLYTFTDMTKIVEDSFASERGESPWKQNKPDGGKNKACIV